MVVKIEIRHYGCKYGKWGDIVDIPDSEAQHFLDSQAAVKSTGDLTQPPQQPKTPEPVTSDSKTKSKG